MSLMKPSRVRPHAAVLRAVDAPPPDRLWRSVEQALAFFFLWGPRLESPRSRGIWSPEELEAVMLDGSPARGEDLRVDVMDIAKCLAGLTDEEDLALRVTFGLAPGARREVRNGIPVYIDNETETLAGGEDAAAPPPRTRPTKTPAFDSSTPSSLRLRPRAARSLARRNRGELSWRDAARRMGWFIGEGRPNSEMVQRRVSSARAKVRDAMAERGMLAGRS